LVDERVTGFSEEGNALVYTDEDGGPVESVRLTPGKPNRVAVDATVTLADPVPARLVLGLDGGDACVRRTLRCKTKRGALACR
jgi:hypothetical protein